MKHFRFRFPFPFPFCICTTNTLQSSKRLNLSSHHALEASHVALLGGDLEVAVDDAVIGISKMVHTLRHSRNLRDSHKNTGTASKSTHQVADNRKSTDAGATEGGSSRNNTLELTVHALVTVTGHDHTLLLELLGDVTRAGARNLNPGLGESGACNKHVGGEDGGVNRVEKSIGKVEWRAHVVDETTGREHLGAALTSLPNTEHLDEEVVGKLVVKHLAEEEDVGG